MRRASGKSCVGPAWAGWEASWVFRFRSLLPGRRWAAFFSPVPCGCPWVPAQFYQPNSSRRGVLSLSQRPPLRWHRSTSPYGQRGRGARALAPGAGAGAAASVSPRGTEGARRCLPHARSGRESHRGNGAGAKAADASFRRFCSDAISPRSRVRRGEEPSSGSRCGGAVRAGSLSPPREARGGSHTPLPPCRRAAASAQKGGQSRSGDALNPKTHPRGPAPQQS